MADQYADAINEAIAALRKGWELARTESETDLWFAALERVTCIETLHERADEIGSALAAVKVGA